MHRARSRASPRSREHRAHQRSSSTARPAVGTHAPNRSSPVATAPLKKPMPSHVESHLRDALQRVAPGTALREGLERILRGRTGAIIVLGDGKAVADVSAGGFAINIEFTPARLRELAKMDGGIVLSRDTSQIRSAAVHFMPNSDRDATESGTRHRTAEHVSVVTGLPVVTVSASMNIIALFVDGHRHTLDRPEVILDRANQALNTLERYRERLESVMDHLTSQELEGSASVRDLALALQRQEMVRRIVSEISSYALELGTEGRLVTLQLEELAAGTEGNTDTLLRDYGALRLLAADAGSRLPAGLEYLLEPDLEEDEVVARQTASLAELSSADLVDLGCVAQILGVNPGTSSIDQVVEPRGLRLLGHVRNLPRGVAERLAEQLGGLQGILAAEPSELKAVEGVGEHRARIIRETLGRIAEHH